MIRPMSSGLWLRSISPFCTVGSDVTCPVAASVVVLLSSNEWQSKHEQGSLDAKRMVDLTAKTFGQITDNI